MKSFLRRLTLPQIAFASLLACVALAYCLCPSTEDFAGAVFAVAPVAGGVSLADRVGATRRAKAEKIEQRGKCYAECEQLEVEEARLSAKADRTDQEAQQLAEVRQKINAGYQQGRKLTNEIDQLGVDEADLQQRLNERNAHNAEVKQLGQSSGRHVQPEAGAIQTGADAGSNVRVINREPTKQELENDLSQFVRAHGCARLTGQHPVAIARDVLGNDRLAQAMTAANNAGMIPDNLRPVVIELLRPRSVIRRMEPMMVPLVNGNLRMPRLATGATANYVGENTNAASSIPDTDSVTLTAKKLIAVVPVTNELLRRSTPGGDVVIRNDLIAAVAQKEDSTFLRSDGTSNTPKGLRFWAPNNSTSRPAANATVNVANIQADLTKLINALETTDVPMIRPSFILAPRVKNYLSTLRDSGQVVFPEMTQGLLRGFPFYVSNQIPTNLGGGTNESEVYFTDASELMLAEEPTFILEASSEAAYHDGSAVQSAYSRDLTVFRIIVEHDFAPRHDNSVAVLTAVTWGG